MTSIFSRAYNALSPLGLPLAMGIYLTANGVELPSRYLVYNLVTSGAEQSADDVETLRAYDLQVTLWDKTGLDSPPDMDGAMRAAGFRKGASRQLPRDPDSGHFGLATDYTFLEET